MTELNLVGRRIGRYEVLAELGRGGMAVVYRARQADLDRDVALKVLPASLSLDQNFIARFQLEARSAAALEHPHIVPIYDVGAVDGLHYIAMKYIDGHTLKEVITEHGAVDPPEAIRLISQVAQALDHAHGRGFIHRDIKPSNIMVDRSGWVYLTDFGLARGQASPGLTMAGVVMGTPEYMSPEQAQGLATIGTPTDIYALGVVLYELLTGQVPFNADTPMAMLVARLQHAPRPPREYRSDLPLPVEDVIMRALARKPEARYATAGALVDALRQAAGAPVPSHAARPAGAPARPAASPASSSGEPTQRVTPAPYVRTAATAPVNAAQVAVAAPPIAAVPPVPAVPRRGPGPIVLGAGALVLLVLLALGALLMLQPRSDPRVADGLEAGAAALSRPDGFDAAIAAYRDVLAIDPDNTDAHARLALIYNLRGAYTQAEQSARAVIDADPESALGYSLLADALSGQGRYEDALAAAEQALDLDDELSLAYGARAAIRADMASEGTDLDLLQQAADDAEAAIASAGDEDNLARALAHSARGYVYWQEYIVTNDESRVGRGVEEYNKAIGLQNQIALFHSNLGYFYDAQGERERAREKFEDAIAADYGYGHAHSGLGWNLYYLEDYQGALGEFAQALELNPEDIDAYIGQSYVYQAQPEPDYDQAIAVLREAAAIAPARPSIFAAIGWAYRSKGIAQANDDDRLANYRESEAHFRDAIALNDRYVDALTGLGWALQDQGYVLDQEGLFEESIEVLLRSLALKPEQESAHNALGWSYLALGQNPEAEEAFRRATELDTAYADAFYGLGEALYAQGRLDEARDAYTRAADLGSSGAQTALAQLE